MLITKDTCNAEGSSLSTGKNSVLQTDREIWQALKVGDEGALGKLMKKYYRSLFSYGCRISRDKAITEDCIQELFVELWAKKEKLGEVQFVKSYLFKSLRRRIARASSSIHLLGIEDVQEQAFEIIFSHEEFIIKEQHSYEWKTRIVNALNSLPARQREIVFLKFYEKLTYEEIAEVMLLGVPTLYNLLSKAVNKLRSILLPSQSAIKVQKSAIRC